MNYWTDVLEHFLAWGVWFPSFTNLHDCHRPRFHAIVIKPQEAEKLLISFLDSDETPAQRINVWTVAEGGNLSVPDALNVSCTFENGSWIHFTFHWKGNFRKTLKRHKDRKWCNQTYQKVLRETTPSCLLFTDWTALHHPHRQVFTTFEAYKGQTQEEKCYLFRRHGDGDKGVKGRVVLQCWCLRVQM